MKRRIFTSYFNYHATAKNLILSGKLKEYYFTEKYKNISPALVLVFDDIKHPIMPIREDHFEEYINLISNKEKLCCDGHYNQESKINNCKKPKILFSVAGI